MYTQVSSRSYGGPSSIAPLRISTFLSCEPKPGGSKQLQDSPRRQTKTITNQCGNSSATYRTQDTRHRRANAPSARTARRRRGPRRRRWRGQRRGGGRPHDRIRAALGPRRHHRRWPRAGCRGASRSTPRNPARGGQPIAPRDLSHITCWGKERYWHEGGGGGGVKGERTQRQRSAIQSPRRSSGWGKARRRPSRRRARNAWGGKGGAGAVLLRRQHARHPRTRDASSPEAAAGWAEPRRRRLRWGWRKYKQQTSGRDSGASMESALPRWSFFPWAHGRTWGTGLGFSVIPPLSLTVSGQSAHSLFWPVCQWEFVQGPYWRAFAFHRGLADGRFPCAFSTWRPLGSDPTTAQALSNSASV